MQIQSYPHSRFVIQLQAGARLRHRHIRFAQKLHKLIGMIGGANLAQHVHESRENIVPRQIGEQNHGGVVASIVATKSESPFRIDCGQDEGEGENRGFFIVLNANKKCVV